MGLAISRRAGDSVFIGEDVEIRIVETHTGSVVLDITAPAAVNIRRGELSPKQEGSDPPVGVLTPAGDQETNPATV